MDSVAAKRHNLAIYNACVLFRIWKNSDHGYKYFIFQLETTDKVPDLFSIYQKFYKSTPEKKYDTNSYEVQQANMRLSQLNELNNTTVGQNSKICDQSRRSIK